MKKRCVTVTAALLAVMMLSPTATVHAEDGIYTVKRGDNLSKIAQEVYGDKSEWRTIYEANKGTIKDANILYAGQQLILPQASQTAEIPTMVEDASAATELPTTNDASATADIPTINENPAVTNIPSVSVSENVSIEGNSYRINTCYQGYDVKVMRPMEVTVAKGDLDKFNSIYTDLLNDHSVPGYEWRAVAVDYVPLNNDDSLEMDWYWNCNIDNTDNWTELDTNWGQTSVYNFTMHCNGVDYTDCKCIVLLDGDIYYNMVDWVLVLAPQNADNTAHFTVYASDGEKAIETDYINIDF